MVDEHASSWGEKDVESWEQGPHVGPSLQRRVRSLGIPFPPKGFQGADRTLCKGVGSWRRNRYIHRSKSANMQAKCRRVLSHVNSTALNDSVNWRWSLAMQEKGACMGGQNLASHLFVPGCIGFQGENNLFMRFMMSRPAMLQGLKNVEEVVLRALGGADGCALDLADLFC